MKAPILLDQPIEGL